MPEPVDLPISSLPVVRLGAICEIAAGDNLDQGGQLSFSVDEFADLADGRRIMLHEHERGFSSRPSGRDRWAHLTAESIRRDVLTTVLPDMGSGGGDDRDSEQHPWDWIAELIGRHKVAVDAESLKTVPYIVEFGDRLQQRLGT